MSVLPHWFQSSKYAAGFADSCLAVFVAAAVTCHIAAQIAKFLSRIDSSISYLDFCVINVSSFRQYSTTNEVCTLAVDGTRYIWYSEEWTGRDASHTAHPLPLLFYWPLYDDEVVTRCLQSRLLLSRCRSTPCFCLWLNRAHFLWHIFEIFLDVVDPTPRPSPSFPSSIHDTIHCCIVQQCTT